jgi:hypothetical protein
VSLDVARVLSRLSYPFSSALIGGQIAFFTVGHEDQPAGNFSPPLPTQFNYFQEIDILFSVVYGEVASQPVFHLLYYSPGRELMLSDKQLEANRRNAQKSTGPRTTEGKSNSSRNNLRHGLTGQLSLLPTEDREAHDAFCNELIDSFNAETPMECQRVRS